MPRIPQLSLPTAPARGSLPRGSSPRRLSLLWHRVRWASSLREGLEASGAGHAGRDRDLAAGDLEGKDKRTLGRCRPCAGLPVSASRSLCARGPRALVHAAPSARLASSLQDGHGIAPGGQARLSRSAAGLCGVETTGDAWHQCEAEAPRGLEGAGQSDSTTSGLGARTPARSAGFRLRFVLVRRPSPARHIAVSRTSAGGGRCVRGQTPATATRGRWGHSDLRANPCPSPHPTRVSTVWPELQIISLNLLCVYFALFWPDIRNFV